VKRRTIKKKLARGRRQDHQWRCRLKDDIRWVARAVEAERQAMLARVKTYIQDSMEVTLRDGTTFRNDYGSGAAQYVGMRSLASVARKVYDEMEAAQKVLGQTVRCTSTPEDLKDGILKITMSVPLPTIVIDFELLPDK
jgi:hypothetical protein